MVSPLFQCRMAMPVSTPIKHQEGFLQTQPKGSDVAAVAGESVETMEDLAAEPQDRGPTEAALSPESKYDVVSG
jgi:hypothetical protein